jgi:hypothetical protein
MGMLNRRVCGQISIWQGPGIYVGMEIRWEYPGMLDKVRKDVDR